MIAAATCNQTHTLRWKSSNEIRPIKDKKQSNESIPVSLTIVLSKFHCLIH